MNACRGCEVSGEQMINGPCRKASRKLGNLGRKHESQSVICEADAT